jgi:hypothetical protein
MRCVSKEEDEHKVAHHSKQLEECIDIEVGRVG